MNEGDGRELKVAEMTKELRSARNWLLAVGILMFVMDQIYIYAIYGSQLPSEYKTHATIVSAVVLAVFIGLYFLASKQPKIALILGLVIFWGIQIYAAQASGDFSSLFKGILIKVFFTAALIKGLQSANRAATLGAELGAVFE